jgi:hypothetical protein
MKEKNNKNNNNSNRLIIEILLVSIGKYLN